MSELSPIVIESVARDVGHVTSHPAGPRARARAHPRATPVPLDDARHRGLGERLLLTGAIAVAGPLVAAVTGALVGAAATLVVLALVLAGPFLLGAILTVAVALIAFLAMGAAG